MCDSPQFKEAPSMDAASDSNLNNLESSIMDFNQAEDDPLENISTEADKEEELNMKPSDSSSPLVSDGKIGNKSITKVSVLSSSHRSTRSKDNPEFVAKQKSFMAKIQAASSGSEPLSPVSDRPDTPGKRKRESSCILLQSGKKKKICKTDNGSQGSIKEWQNDNCCWECHREGQFICCEMCPRVFHLKCAGLEKEPEEDWACSECHAVMQAENVENRSRAMQLISVDQLCILLKYALNRLKAMPVMDPFSKPVDISEFPTYWDIVVHPVDFSSLEKNIKKKFYGSTEAFLSDARWIVHNSVIFNGAHSKVTSLAKTLIKILKQELSEIETCPDCYENAHKKPDRWFSEACRLAHPLVWARLKGFPFWPAKAVKWKDSNVDVRFFGRHDRSWVPLKECFLLSEQMPTPLKNRNKTLEACMLEVEDHIKKLKERFGKFKHAPHRLPFNPYDNDQIRVILPLYKGPAILRIRSQPFSSRPPGYSGTDDETSSIASTDSGNSSYSRWRKRSLKDRSALNTPDTETETDNISMEDDTLLQCKIEDSMDTKDDMEEEEGMDANYTVSTTEENEPPDKTERDEEEVDGEKKYVINNDEGKETDDVNENNKEDIENDEVSKESNMLNNIASLDEYPHTKSCNSEDAQSCQQSECDKSEEPFLALNEKTQFTPDNDSSLKDIESESKDLDMELPLKISKAEDLEDKENTLLKNKIEDIGEMTTTLKINKSLSMKVIKLTSVKINKDQKSSLGGSLTLTAVKRVLEEKGKENVKITEKEEEMETKDVSNEQTDGLLNKDDINCELNNESELIINEDEIAKSIGDSDDNKDDCNESVFEDANSVIKSTELSSKENLIDENVRNFEKINELLRSEAIEEEEKIINEKEEEQLEEEEKEKEDLVGGEENKDLVGGEENEDLVGGEENENIGEEEEEMEDVEIDKDKSTEMVLSKLSEMLDESLKAGKKLEKESKTNLEPKSNDVGVKEDYKKDKLEEMMDDHYFQGFLDEINLRKKLEAYQEMIKNVRCGKVDLCDPNSEEMSEIEDEENVSKSNENCDFNEQLLTNTSLTIGKVSLPKSIKFQKISERDRKSSLEEDDDFNGAKFSLPSVNIRSVLNASKNDSRKKEFENEDGEVKKVVDDREEQEEEDEEDISLKEDFSKMEGNSSIMDFQNFANKIFHNITISSKSSTGDKEAQNSQKPSKGSSQNFKNTEDTKASGQEPNEIKERRKSRETEEQEKPEQKAKVSDSSEHDKEREDSLMEAVKLVKKIGNIAIKRVDSQTLEHTSGSDRVTISVANSTSGHSNKLIQSSSNRSTKSSSPTEKKNDNPLAGFGTSVSVTKASDKEREKDKDKEKIKMPSGVDTTRLSPSISIIPVSSTSSEKPKDKISSTLGPSSTPQSSSITTPTTTMTTVCSSSASPSVSAGGSTTPSSSISASPNIPPPPLLSHSLPSPTGTNVRGMFGPPIGGIGMPGGPRTPITSPGLRMMGNSPGMMMGGRFPGPPMGRHLPPEAGPLSNELHKHAHKLAEMMRASLEEVLGGLVGLGTPEARLGALQLELERCNWRHQQELIEVRHNADVMLVEMRANLDAEKQRAVEEARRQMEQKLVEMRRQMEMQMAEKLSEVRRQADIEKQRSIEETKKKQWCANCGKEALFFCCWNTSYCDYPCQQAHWPQHMSVCGQNSDTGGGGNHSNTDGGMESVNGDASSHSSRGATPVQGHHGGHIKNLIEDEDICVEETKIRRNRLDGRSECSAAIPGLVRTLKKTKRKSQKKKRIKSKLEGQNCGEDGSDSEPVSLVRSPLKVDACSRLLDWFTGQQRFDSVEEKDDALENSDGFIHRKRRRKKTVDDDQHLSGLKKKRKSTPCVRKRIDLILSPDQVTADMLAKVATKPKEKLHNRGTGTSCHQCRQKTSDTKTICRSGRCVGLRGFFCGPCLKTRYGEDARKAILDPNWCCPVCRGICNCSLCRKTRRSVPLLGAKSGTGEQKLLDSHLSGGSDEADSEDN